MRDDVLRIGVCYEESVIDVHDGCSVVDQAVATFATQARQGRSFATLVRGRSRNRQSIATFAGLQRSQGCDVRKAAKFARLQRSRRQPICLQNEGTLLRGRASDAYMRNFKNCLHACTAYVLNVSFICLYTFLCVNIILSRCMYTYIYI